MSDGRPTDRLEMHARAAGVGTPSFFWPALFSSPFPSSSPLLQNCSPPLLSANGWFGAANPLSDPSRALHIPSSFLNNHIPSSSSPVHCPRDSAHESSSSLPAPCTYSSLVTSTLLYSPAPALWQFHFLPTVTSYYTAPMDFWVPCFLSLARITDSPQHHPVLCPGLTKLVGTGPVTGQTGPGRLRFGPVSNRPKFKI